MSTRHSRPKGALLALLSATFWGLSGTVAQALFRESGITPEWFVVVRLLSSGALLLLFSLILKKRSGDLWSIWRNPRDRVSLMLFGLIGMLGVQYTYLVAIDKSNAATATFLQYLAPLFVVGALSLIERKWPRQMELLGVLLAIGGTFFLVTGGKGDGMAITVPAFLWGIASAITLAFYTLQPTYLLNRYESITIVGWGMLIGGFGFGLFHPP